MMKLVIIAFLAVFAVVKAREISGEDNNINNNEIAPLEKESRVLREAPLIGILIVKSLKIIWFFLSTFCSVLDYKLAALALTVNVGFYLFSNCYPVIVGTVLMFGFCKLTGLCSHGYAFVKDDPLAYAADHLQSGALKYEDNL